MLVCHSLLLIMSDVWDSFQSPFSQNHLPTLIWTSVFIFLIKFDFTWVSNNLFVSYILEHYYNIYMCIIYIYTHTTEWVDNRSHWTAQGTLFSILWWTIMEKNMKKDKYVCMTESLCWTAVINTALWINYTSVKTNWEKNCPIPLKRHNLPK